ncbi:hypothetical protein TKK_0003751 [Trichogramma kaykai]
MESDDIDDSDGEEKSDISDEKEQSDISDEKEQSDISEEIDNSDGDEELGKNNQLIAVVQNRPDEDPLLNPVEDRNDGNNNQHIAVENPGIGDPSINVNNNGNGNQNRNINPIDVLL